MKKIKFNKGNWSGETGEITVYNDGSFKYYDYKLKFNVREFNGGDKVYTIVDQDTKQEYGKVYQCDKQYVSSGMGIERESDSLYISAGQLLSNIL